MNDSNKEIDNNGKKESCGPKVLAKQKTIPTDINVKEMPQAEVVRIYMPFVRSIANQITARCPANVEIDDLINVGVIGLMDAIEKYDPQYGKPFRFYAELRIRGEIIDELRQNDWVPRSTRRKFEEIDKIRTQMNNSCESGASDKEIALAAGVKLENYHKILGNTQSGSFLSIEDVHTTDEECKDLYEVLKGDGLTPDLELTRRELEDSLKVAIAELPDREKLLISLYYFKDMPLKEIGARLGVTESRASQLHSRALSRLKKAVDNAKDDKEW